MQVRHNRPGRSRSAGCGPGELSGVGEEGRELEVLSARAAVFMSCAACILRIVPKSYCTPTMMSDGRPDGCLASGSDHQIRMVQDNRLRMQSSHRHPGLPPARPDDCPTPCTWTRQCATVNTPCPYSQTDIRLTLPLRLALAVGKYQAQPGTTNNPRLDHNSASV